MIYVAVVLIVLAVALFVAAPLAGGLGARRRVARDVNTAKLAHDRALAVQGLRELEFDHEMRKLSDTDYRELRAALEARALAAMSEAEKPAPKPHIVAAQRPRRARIEAPMQRRIRFCPQCGARAVDAANFCAECGTSLKALEWAAGKAE